MDVQNIMTKALITARPDQSVREAFQILEDSDIRHLPVVDEDRLVGMVSDRDLREYRLPILQEESDPETAEELLGTLLSSVMNGNVLALDTGESLTAAVDLMIEYGVGALPVIDRHSEELVGIVSYVDILKAIRPSLDVE